jgi:hypothetical protein
MNEELKEMKQELNEMMKQLRKIYKWMKRYEFWKIQQTGEWASDDVRPMDPL